MKHFKKDIGTLGENIAEDYLLKNGYKILCKNFYCKIGEIDLICQYEDIICIIEVKSRYNTKFGSPSESINYRKQKKIIKSSQYYLLKNGLTKSNVRFDVIEVLLNYKNTCFRINHIKNAFIT